MDATTTAGTASAADAAGAPRPAQARSQTLVRGIDLLERLAEAGEPLAIADLSARLGLHRSIVYRLLRTFEDRGLVERDADGRARLGPGLASLARSVAQDVQAAALPELAQLANELDATAFLSVLDRGEAVTLVSAEPRASLAAVARRAGARHPINRGAPGVAIQTMLSPNALEELAARGLAVPPATLDRARAAGYATSHSEVVEGLSSVAVPMDLPGRGPSSLAVIHIMRPGAAEPIGRRLRLAAREIAAAFPSPAPPAEQARRPGSTG